MDAFIISDLGVLALAKQVAPQVERHVSTQTGIVNFAAAQVCWELGAKRVVLAREVPLSEIRGIRERVDPQLELEAFVHGAMCMSFSGRCVISNYMTGRDANRGECAQPCRWEYHLMETQRPGEVYTLVQEEKGAYFFNSNDLRMIDHIPEMIDAGVASLKIEGRPSRPITWPASPRPTARPSTLPGSIRRSPAGGHPPGNGKDQPPALLPRVLLWGRAGPDRGPQPLYPGLRAGGHLPGPGGQVPAPYPAQPVFPRPGGGYPPAGGNPPSPPPWDRPLQPGSGTPFGGPPRGDDRLLGKPTPMCRQEPTCG